MGFLSSRARTLSTGQPYNGCDLAELLAKSRRNLSTREPDHVPFPQFCSVAMMAVYWPKGGNFGFFFFFLKLKCRKLT